MPQHASDSSTFNLAYIVPMLTSRANVSCKKQLIGRTDLDIAISNQYGRLIANVVIAYNSIMLSMLLDRYRSADNQSALAILKRISPVAWQHIHFLGHYAFRDNKKPIDLDAILASISHCNLKYYKISGVWAYSPYKSQTIVEQIAKNSCESIYVGKVNR
jgi:hypothetical protein